jgi:hypothetical protein
VLVGPEKRIHGRFSSNSCSDSRSISTCRSSGISARVSDNVGDELFIRDFISDIRIRSREIEFLEGVSS